MKSKNQVGFLSNLVGVAHIDLGVAFALKHAKNLFLLSLAPALLSLIVIAVGFYYPLNVQQRYLLLLLDIFAIVWLLVSTALYTISTFQNTKFSFTELLQRSFLSMPKVIISTLVLSFITISLVVLVFLFVLLVFLFWAPMFCAFELAVKPSTNEKYKVDHEFDDDEDVVFVKKQNVLLFAQKSVMDLGFARSVQFVSSNYIVTFELLLLTWVFMVVPSGLIFLLGGSLNYFPLLVLKTFLGYIIFAFLGSISAVILLSSLSKEALAEISVNPDQAVEKFIELPVKIKYHRKVLKWILLILLGIYFTRINFYQMMLSNNMPQSAQVNVEGIEIKNKQLIFKLQLADNENLFRWLDPQKLFISFEKEDAEVKKDQLSQEATPNKNSTWNLLLDLAQEDGKYLRPVRVMPYTISGEALNETSFVPYKGPIKLVLYFDNPLPEDLDKYHFKLYHQLFPTGNDRPILEGKLANERRD